MSNLSFETLRKFLIKHAKFLVYYEGEETNPGFPDFDLYARDYLQFAELEIEQLQQSHDNLMSSRYLLNCISYLKRAIDCAVDTFLATFGLLSTFQERNLSLNVKLKFLRAAGVFSSYTLYRLNTVRNKMEHEYRIPKMQELEVYFDLVSAFVSVLELNMTFASNKRSMFVVFAADDDFVEGIELKYNYDAPSISVQWWDDLKVHDSIERDLTKPDEFAFLLKVFVLLHQLGRVISSQYIENILTD
jgi:hypothetical protein